MNDNKLVSIVIPLYNRANKIERTIESINKQTYSNIEIIIVDDGSSDFPELVIEKLSNKNILFHKKLNEGANIARNFGAKLASGKYLAFLDSDDEYLPTHIENGVKLLQSNPNKIVYSQVYAKRSEEVGFIKPKRAILENENMAEYLLCNKGFVQTSTLLLSKNVFSQITFDPSLKAGQDTDFAIRAYNLGYHFIMQDSYSVIWDDVYDPIRISSTPHPKNRILWLNSIKESIPKKAYYSDLGWHCAKALFRQNGTSKFTAIYYFFRALMFGCYSFKHSIEVALQIFLPKRYYQKLADKLLKVGYR
ncbi:UDP-Glc:alpha-D-GlcNAc-diphosphoundecaprenol beta-1,3-glucosyltransferase WfgD [Pseudoalteromonas sp. P1-30]|uniref:glycosyltransferase family 2 protein n=1 Tax=Pseudoalteromonas sp. P1-30 TaxID=1723760 RepID=UPI0006D6346E|nr:glycosyltransferase family 2 protein [Pseudoalteromonas sp. P1-30]KPV91509.1 UDP-Glc:alpha-D-GlcNAc-diphosphoundecaprenol beta-1,3-glucosyltransferase WfgD [Pseudoalteromonas sp. P1-30]